MNPWNGWNSETAVVFHADDGAYGYVVMPLSRDR